MRRRDLLALLGTAAALTPLAGATEAADKIWRIGFLDGGPEAARRPLFDLFRQGMAKRGYVEASNIAYDRRHAEGHFERLPELVRQLLALSPDALLVATTPAAVAAISLPIVIVAVTDPVGTGLVQSLVHPGGNITGITNIAAELTGKRLQILKEMVPAARRIAALVNPDDPNAASQLRYAEDAARELHVELQPVIHIRSAAEVETAFAAAVAAKAEAAIRLVDPLVTSLAEKTAAAELEYRLPVIHASRQSVAAGSLVSYGADGPSQFVQAADLMDKILRGAKPADLPVEQPTKFELVINLKTAKTLGLTVPQSLLARADEVIE
jgi:putative ABC transport system substrate-binding protein